MGKEDKSKSKIIKPIPNEVDKKNEKAETFLRLAPKRIDLLIHRIKLLGNLANRSSYSYTQEQIDQMFKIIGEKLDIAKSKFSVAKESKSTFIFT